MITEMKIYTPAFQNLLMLMSRIKTDEELSELTQVVSDFYARRVDDEMDELWDKGVINEDLIKDWTQEHMRTPYLHSV